MKVVDRCRDFLEKLDVPFFGVKKRISSISDHVYRASATYTVDLSSNLSPFLSKNFKNWDSNVPV